MHSSPEFILVVPDVVSCAGTLLAYRFAVEFAEAQSKKERIEEHQSGHH
jgi:hypothetical protein